MPNEAKDYAAVREAIYGWHDNGKYKWMLNIDQANAIWAQIELNFCTHFPPQSEAYLQKDDKSLWVHIHVGKQYVSLNLNSIRMARKVVMEYDRINAHPTETVPQSESAQGEERPCHKCREWDDSLNTCARNNVMSTPGVHSDTCGPDHQYFKPVPSAPSEEELLACPHCGDAAWIHSGPAFGGGVRGWRVECEGDCHAMTCWWHTRDEAINAWNRRVALAISPREGGKGGAE